MSYTKQTGGSKEFSYSSEDIKCIESEDTESTKKFKNALRKHYSSNKHNAHSEIHGKKHIHKPKQFMLPIAKTFKKIPSHWRLILITFVISLILSYASFYLKNSLLSTLNILSWIVFSFFSLKDLFIVVNLADLGDDLTYWIVGIVGVILFFFGISFGIFLIAVSYFNLNPFGMGMIIISFGIAILGLFMVLRTQRRYQHIYINR